MFTLVQGRDHQGVLQPLVVDDPVFHVALAAQCPAAGEGPAVDDATVAYILLLPHGTVVVNPRGQQLRILYARTVAHIPLLAWQPAVPNGPESGCGLRSRACSRGPLCRNCGVVGGGCPTTTPERAGVPKRAWVPSVTGSSPPVAGCNRTGMRIPWMNCCTWKPGPSLFLQGSAFGPAHCLWLTDMDNAARLSLSALLIDQGHGIVDVAMDSYNYFASEELPRMINDFGGTMPSPKTMNCDRSCGSRSRPTERPCACKYPPGLCPWRNPC